MTAQEGHWELLGRVCGEEQWIIPSLAVPLNACSAPGSIYGGGPINKMWVLNFHVAENKTLDFAVVNTENKPERYWHDIQEFDILLENVSSAQVEIIYTPDRILDGAHLYFHNPYSSERTFVVFGIYEHEWIGTSPMPETITITSTETLPPLTTTTYITTTEVVPPSTTIITETSTETITETARITITEREEITITEPPITTTEIITTTNISLIEKEITVIETQAPITTTRNVTIIEPPKTIAVPPQTIIEKTTTHTETIVKDRSRPYVISIPIFAILGFIIHIIRKLRARKKENICDHEPWKSDGFEHCGECAEIIQR